MVDLIENIAERLVYRMKQNMKWRFMLWAPSKLLGIIIILKRLSGGWSWKDIIADEIVALLWGNSLFQSDDVKVDYHGLSSEETRKHLEEQIGFYGDLGKVKKILGTGFDINQKITADGETPYLVAASHGRLEIAEYLLKNGANPKSVNENGYNALMPAVESGSIRAVDFFIKHTDKMNKTDNEGYTPLMRAAYNGIAEIVELLLKEGADKDRKSKDGENQTALDIAKSYCDDDRETYGPICELLE